MSNSKITQRVEIAVHRALQEALELDADEITPGASIIDDLGAESIDLLDIRFRLEKDLDLRITNEDLVGAFSGADTVEKFRKAFTVEAMCLYLAKRMEADGG